MSHELPRLVVLISGSGSNLQALIDAISTESLQAEIVAVFSNRKAAYGLERAAAVGLPTQYFPFKPYKDANRPREDYDADLAGEVVKYGPDLIVLAGWMHILSPTFLNTFPDKVINLHPALPGEFVGTNGIERAFEAFQQGEITRTGCMVHYVIPEVDAGPVIGTEEVPIYKTDSLEDLQERMHAAEHKLLVRCVRQAIQDSIKYKG